MSCRPAWFPSRCRVTPRPNNASGILGAVSDGRTQLESLVEILDREIEEPLVRPREPAVAERVGVGRIFTDRPVEVCDRAIEFAKLEKDDAPIVEGVGVVGIQPNRLVVVAQGAIELVALRNAFPRLLNASAARGFNRMASS